MAKFRGTFVHTIEQTWEFEIEAKTREEARELIEEDPFEYLLYGEPYDEQGLNVKEVEFKNE